MQTTMQDYGDGAPVQKALARFYMRAKKDAAASLKEGRDIYREQAYVELRAPGDKSSVMHRPVRDIDKANYRGGWQAFESGREQTPDGTPLNMWPQVNTAQVMEFSYFGVQTVEQLSELSDAVCGKFMGSQELKRKAKDFIRAAKSGAPMAEMRHTNKKLKEEIAAMRADMDGMMEELKAAKAGVTAA